MQVTTKEQREAVYKREAARMSEAIVFLMRKPEFAFFAALVVQQEVKQSTNIMTAATNGKELLYNPWFTSTLDAIELKGLLLHEVLHVALQHPVRAPKNADKAKKHHHMLWNVACDYAVNHVVKAMSALMLPDGALVDYPGVEKKSANDIFAELLAKMPEPPEQEQKGQGEGDEGEGDQGEGQGSGSGNDDNNEQQGDGPGGGRYDKPMTGKPNPQDWVEVLPVKGDGDEASQAQAEHELGTMIKRAEMAAKAQGHLPGALRDQISKAQPSRINWREELRRFMDDNANADYSWARPNRRFAGGDLLMPSMESGALGDFAVAIDTSGSMSKREIEAAWGETCAILDIAGKDEVDVLWCDTRVHHTRVATDMPGLPVAVGGGGTDVRPVFEWIHNQAEVQPRVLIYITDGGFDRWPTAPGYETLWLITCPQGQTYWYDGVRDRIKEGHGFGHALPVAVEY
jgi:predicted metal-dependent peptidase